MVASAVRKLRGPASRKDTNQANANQCSAEPNLNSCVVAVDGTVIEDSYIKPDSHIITTEAIETDYLFVMEQSQ